MVFLFKQNRDISYICYNNKIHRLYCFCDKITMLVFFYVTPNGDAIIQDWIDSLGKQERAKLENKLDAICRAEMDILPGMVSGTRVGKISKIRVNGQRALRPMLCKGPFGEDEITILCAAEEKDRKLKPKDAAKIAKNRMDELERGVGTREQYEPPEA